MKDLLLTLLHLTVMTATLCGPGGVRAVIAENLLLKQQLIVLRRPRQRAPHLTASDRLLFGFCGRSHLTDKPCIGVDDARPDRRVGESHAAQFGVSTKRSNRATV